MRLLNAKTHKLESYDDEQTVPGGYAILSHTWGSEDEEISFEDFKAFRLGLGQSSTVSLPSSDEIHAARDNLPESKSPGWAKIDGTCNKALECKHHLCPVMSFMIWEVLDYKT